MRIKRSLLQSWMILALALSSTPYVQSQEQHSVAEPAPQPISYAAPGRDSYLKFAEEIEAALRRDVLGVWFPRTVDKENGGFRCNFTRDWQPSAGEGKFSVFQGRMTWIAAQIVRRRPDLKDQFLPVVRHGMDFLSNVLWDKQ